MAKVLKWRGFLLSHDWMMSFWGEMQEHEWEHMWPRASRVVGIGSNNRGTYSSGLVDV